MVRLVAGGVDYFPVGTLENQKTLWVNRVDDPLFVDARNHDRGADFVFYVDQEKVLGGDPKKPTIADGVFIEVKRLARVDLSGRSVLSGVANRPIIAPPNILALNLISRAARTMPTVSGG